MYLLGQENWGASIRECVQIRINTAVGLSVTHLKFSAAFSNSARNSECRHDGF